MNNTKELSGDFGVLCLTMLCQAIFSLYRSFAYILSFLILFLYAFSVCKCVCLRLSMCFLCISLARLFLFQLFDLIWFYLNYTMVVTVIHSPVCILMRARPGIDSIVRKVWRILGTGGRQIIMRRYHIKSQFSKKTMKWAEEGYRGEHSKSNCSFW